MGTITQSRLRELFHYRDDGWLIRAVQTGPAAVGTVAGFMTRSGNKRQRRAWSVGIDGKIYLIHRMVWLYHHGWLPPEIDHINRDSTDNRIENLRPSSRAENLANARISSRNSSGVRGVFWSPKSRKWRARIVYDGKTHDLGWFKSIEDATVVIREKRQQLNPEYFSP